LIDLNLALTVIGFYGMLNLIVGIVIGRWTGRPTPSKSSRREKG